MTCFPKVLFLGNLKTDGINDLNIRCVNIKCCVVATRNGARKSVHICVLLAQKASDKKGLNRRLDGRGHF